MNANASQRSPRPAPVDVTAPRIPGGGTWDWWLLGASVILAGFGLLMILSASSVQADADFGDALLFVTRQGIGLLLGVLGAVAVLRIPWRWLRRSAWVAWLGTVISLLLVMTPLGHASGGAARWLVLGGLRFQPSEVAKVALVLVLAHYLAANAGRIKDVVGTVLPAVGLTAPIVFLVLMQPDFGTTVILVGLLGVLLFLAGLQWRWLAGFGLVAATGLAMVAVAAPYRLRRLTAFTDPFADPSDAGYQVVQGWIAMAQGGLFGRGIGAGVAQSGFLPEAHTDSIAAVVGEELGAVGWVLMVALQLVLVWRATVLADRSRELFGTLLAGGLAALLGAQAIVNLGVVCGLLPTKGLVLPFLSYGASAAVMHTVCIGLLLRIGLDNPIRGRS